MLTLPRSESWNIRNRHLSLCFILGKATERIFALAMQQLHQVTRHITRKRKRSEETISTYSQLTNTHKSKSKKQQKSKSTNKATMVTNKMSTPTISSRNKSLVSLHDSLQEGFLRHNIDNRAQSTLLPAIDDNCPRSSAFVSPTSSCSDLRHELAKAMEEQQQEQDENDVVQATRDLSLASRGPASIAADNAQQMKRMEEIASRKRRALAAKLRARGVSHKLVLKPSDFARSIFKRNRSPLRDQRSNGASPFHEPTKIDMEIHAKHSQRIYDFVRKGNDLEGFKQCIYELQHTYKLQGKPFRCSNRFGESLMHLACRRGRTEIVRFLVEELPGVTPSQMLSIKDDCLKTPLHDACWTASPNVELVELILNHAPEQVIMQDIRGNTPFDYVRKEDYQLWLRFLWERKNLLQTTSTPQRVPTNWINVK